jgi:hypothetical protein
MMERIQAWHKRVGKEKEQVVIVSVPENGMFLFINEDGKFEEDSLEMFFLDSNQIEAIS